MTTWTITTQTTLDHHLGNPGTTTTVDSNQALIAVLADAMRNGQRGDIQYRPAEPMKPATLKKISNQIEKIEKEAHRQALS